MTSLGVTRGADATARTHYAPDGALRNPWPNSGSPEWPHVLRLLSEFSRRRRDARAPLMLAIHGGTFRLTTEAMDEPPRRTMARWHDVGLDPDRLWVARFGVTRSLVPERPH